MEQAVQQGVKQFRMSTSADRIFKRYFGSDIGEEELIGDILKGLKGCTIVDMPIITQQFVSQLTTSLTV